LSRPRRTIDSGRTDQVFSPAAKVTKASTNCPGRRPDEVSVSSARTVTAWVERSALLPTEMTFAVAPKAGMSTVMPVRKAPARRGGTCSSIHSGVMRAIFRSGVCASTRWPGETARSITVPATGATIAVLLSKTRDVTRPSIASGDMP
jgi:hypothetical protein